MPPSTHASTPGTPGPFGLSTLRGLREVADG